LKVITNSQRKEAARLKDLLRNIWKKWRGMNENTSLRLNPTTV